MTPEDRQTIRVLTIGAFLGSSMTAFTFLFLPWYGRYAARQEAIAIAESQRITGGDWLKLRQAEEGCHE